MRWTKRQNGKLMMTVRIDVDLDKDELINIIRQQLMNRSSQFESKRTPISQKTIHTHVYYGVLGGGETELFEEFENDAYLDEATKLFYKLFRSYPSK